MTPPDVLHATLRALAFIAVTQAAGAGAFLPLLASHHQRARAALRRAGMGFALAGVVFTLAAHALQPARMTGTFDGVLDASLHSLLLASDAGPAHGLRVAGLVVMLVALQRAGRGGEASAIIGATLIGASFAFMGHTATHDQRWLLAPLLVLHVLVAAFWMGALLSFRLAGRGAYLPDHVPVIARFSVVAVWLVPAILAAGLAMAVLLLPSPASLFTPYGALLTTKLVAFAVLLALATLNKWRLAPLIGASEGAAASFRRSVLAEWLLIAGVLGATAVMTSFFSPA